MKGKSSRNVIVATTCISVVIMLYRYTGLSTTEPKQNNYSPQNSGVYISSVRSNKPLIVMGILSRTENKKFRNYQRKTWISTMKYLQNSLPFKIKYKFLIDFETRRTVFENKVHNDILFLNVSHQGQAVKFGHKMYKWLRYINLNYPDALLGIKMDDDVFLCVPHVFDVLNEIKSTNLYFGFKWSEGESEHVVSKKTRIDEMFVVLGNTLINKIANRRYCDGSICDEKIELFDTNKGGSSLGLWLSIYKDIDFVAGNDQLLATRNKTTMRRYAKATFCTNYILMHKCVPAIMAQLHSFNDYKRHSNTNVSTIGHVTGSIFSGKIERELPNKTIQNESVFVSMDTFPYCDNWAVVTTIFNPSKAVKYISEKVDWCLVIVADLKTPTERQYLSEIVSSSNENRIKFLSLWEQAELYPTLSNIIPNNHFGRKNIGYIYAIQHRAKLIWDFDDDNIGIFNLNDLLKNEFVTICEPFKTSIINPYPYFGTSEKYVWPRGIPLQYIKDNTTHPSLCKFQRNVSIGVIQSLANKQPDVDAIFRLTRDVPFNFQSTHHTHKKFILPKDSYSPFNAQATLWHKSAFPYIALPISINGRVSDIWRSYIAQYFMHKFKLSLAFAPPYVVQERNNHTIIADLDAEKDLYLKSLQFVQFLQNAKTNSMTGVYKDLYQRQYLEEDDLHFIFVWYKTLQAISN